MICTKEDNMDKKESMKLLLNIIDDDYEPNNSLDSDNVDKKLLSSAMKLSIKNGLYYYFSKRIKQINADLNFNESVNLETKTELSKFKNTLDLIDHTCSSEKINYVLIKDCNTISHIPRDIDILVKKKDRKRMIQALEIKGMRLVQDSVAETSLIDKNMKVDIYTEICYIGFEFIDVNFLLESQVPNQFFGQKYMGLTPEATFLLMLVHSLFGHRSMTLLDFLHLKNIKNDLDMDICRKYAYKNRWGKVFDYVSQEFCKLEHTIYEEKKIVYFPYMFKKEFFMKCISEIDNSNLTFFNKVFISITFIQDGIINELKDTPLYNFVKNYEPARNLVNTFTASTKIMRGDKKSSNDSPNVQNKNNKREDT